MTEKKINIIYFHRKPEPAFHSIENVFYRFQSLLPQNYVVNNYFMKYKSTGIFNRLLLIYEAFKNQSDINHITGFIHFIILLLNKKKTILTIHDLAPVYQKNIFKRFFIKLFWFTIPCKQANYITVISEFTKKQLLETVRIKAEKVVIIPNSVPDNLVFTPKPFNAEKPVLLQIGTKPNKNLERLIPALNGINCKLVIIGNLNNTQLNLLIENNIDYENLKNQPFDQIIKFYQQADIVAFVTLYEGFGLPLIEANAIGCVVISSNISPITENAGNAALLVNPHEIMEIRNGILTLINNSKLRNELIENGKENVKRFRPEAVAQQYKLLYDKICSGND